jgi:thiol-disulfide isomerase/thioredoxin
MFRINIIGLVLLLAIAFACNNGPEQQVRGSIPVYTSFEELRPVLERENDTLYVINFWATWCVPCVKELPYFEKVNAEYGSHKVKVMLVSLDFIDDLETSLIPFIEKHQLKSEVVLLDDPDANRWIPMVHPDWDGAIPVTLFRQGNQSSFIAHAVTYDELVNEINNYIKR